MYEKQKFIPNLVAQKSSLFMFVQHHFRDFQCIYSQRKVDRHSYKVLQK